METSHGTEILQARVRVLEDYVYKLEREVSELMKEILMWRIKYDPTYESLAPDEEEPF